MGDALTLRLMLTSLRSAKTLPFGRISASISLLGLSVSVIALAVACGGDDRSSGFDDDSDDDGGSGNVSSSSGGAGGGTSSGGGIIGDDGGGGGGGGCSDRARLVYVLSSEDELYSFNPAELEFQKIGTLDCPTKRQGASPNSMAIDREGTAWVGYSDAELFKVDTVTAECTATSFDYAGVPFGRYGMGFSSDAVGSNAETLYLVGIGDDGRGKGLYKLDTNTIVSNKVGDFGGPLRNVSAELTGTGNAELFGFFTSSPPVLAQIDKDSAATSNTTSLSTINFNASSYAFAFSYWGGDFWFYSSVNDNPSKVTRLRTATDGNESVVVNNVGGFRIVGAGVSTCAPTSPVN